MKRITHTEKTSGTLRWPTSIIRSPGWTTSSSNRRPRSRLLVIVGGRRWLLTGFPRKSKLKMSNQLILLLRISKSHMSTSIWSKILLRWHLMVNMKPRVIYRLTWILRCRRNSQIRSRESKVPGSSALPVIQQFKMTLVLLKTLSDWKKSVKKDITYMTVKKRKIIRLSQIIGPAIRDSIWWT